MGLDSSRNLNLIVEGQSVDSISLSDPSQSQTSELLAYRPNYEDYHDSGLAGIFVNIKKVFPCTEGIVNYGQICSTFATEEDGFRKGKAYIELGDNGYQNELFWGKMVSVYGLAVQGCQQLNSDCLPTYVQTEVVCLLPRTECP